MLVETDVAPEVRLFTTESHPQLVEDYSAWYSVPSTASSVPPRDGRFLILPIEAVSQPSDPSSVTVSICVDPPRKEKSLIKDNTSRRSSRQYLFHTSCTLWTIMKWTYMRLKAAVIVSWIIGIICKTKARKAAILLTSQFVQFLHE